MPPRRSSNMPNSSSVIVRRAFYPIFVILLSGSNSKLQRVLSHLLDCIVIICFLFVISNEFHLVVLDFNFAPVGLLLSAMGGNFCSVGIRILLTKKNNCLLSNALQIFDDHGIADFSGSERLALAAAFCGCWIIPVAMITGDTKTAMEEDGDEYTQKLMFHGLYFADIRMTYLAVFLRFISVQQVYALPGCCTVLSIYACKLMTRAIRKSEKDLKSEYDLKQIFFKYIQMSTNLSKSLEKAQAALSPMLLLLYCYLMSCIFIVMTLTIKIWPTSIVIDVLLNQLAILIMCMVAFLTLSIQALNVHNAAVSFKRTIYKLCVEQFTLARSSEESFRFLLLNMAETFNADTEITIGGLISVNRNFILQTTGVIISYGIIIAQLDSN